VHIAAFCYLQGCGGISIGDYANISCYVGIHSVSDDASGNSLTNPMIPEKLKMLNKEKVIIDSHAIIFAKASIMPGTRMFEGAVLGAHSLAKADIPAWHIFGGVPARFLRERARSLLELVEVFEMEL
jgi:acetyltransferase-like isoleucine patch superfamily enzyme